MYYEKNMYSVGAASVVDAHHSLYCTHRTHSDDRRRASVYNSALTTDRGGGFPGNDDEQGLRIISCVCLADVDEWRSMNN